MSRPLRISFDNAVCHITTRENRKEKIFYQDDDKRVFLQKMNQLTRSRIIYKRYILGNLTMDFPVKDIYRGMTKKIGVCYYNKTKRKSLFDLRFFYLSRGEEKGKRWKNKERAIHSPGK